MGRRLAFMLFVLLLVAVGACDTNDGRDSVFTTEPRPTTTLALTPPTTTAVPVQVQLRADGLGGVAFGRTAVDAEAALTPILGQPDERIDPVPGGSSRWGVCPGETVRGMRWGRFTILLTTGVTEVNDDGVEHFSAFRYGWPPTDSTTPTLHTDGGIGIGSTVAQLRAAHGATVRVFEDALIGPAFSVERLRGALTSTADDGTVVNIGGGVRCGE